MKFTKSTHNTVEDCLNLVTWEANHYDQESKEYQWLLDIIVLLDLKLGELIYEN